MASVNKDYSKGKIYTIKNKKNETDIYVGSTILPYLSQRFCVHRQDARLNKSNCLLHTKMRETDDVKDWYIELYEEYPCNTKQELLKREGEVIRQIATLNKNIPGLTYKEKYTMYNRRNKEYLRNYYLRKKAHKANVSIVAEAGLDGAGEDPS